jgi:hypothetical protein
MSFASHVELGGVIRVAAILPQQRTGSARRRVRFDRDTGAKNIVLTQGRKDVETQRLFLGSSLRLCVKLGGSMTENEISKHIVECAIEVHRTLGGPGLLEDVYGAVCAGQDDVK